MVKKFNYILLSLFILNNCGSSGTKAKVAFVNLDALNASSQNIKTIDASIVQDNANKITSLNIKIIAIYLAQDMDEDGDNIGATTMLFLNPNCKNNISLCDISEPNSNHNPNGKKYNIVEYYFDLARSSDEVNDQIKAQYRSIKPGTYKYLRFEFCKYNDESSKTLAYSGILDGETFGPIELLTGGCVFNINLNTTLNIEDGDSVTVNLNYSYDNSFVHGDVGDVFDSNLGFINESGVTKGNKIGYLIFPDFSNSTVEK